jgi:hypothetical protein
VQTDAGWRYASYSILQRHAVVASLRIGQHTNVLALVALQ